MDATAIAAATLAQRLCASRGTIIALRREHIEVARVNHDQLSGQVYIRTPWFGLDMDRYPVDGVLADK